MSDITTGDGRYIDRSIYEGVPNNCMTDTYEWPIQGKPGKMKCHEWKSALELIFDVSITTLRLSESYHLNKWDEDIPSLQWQWWYCSVEDILYKRYSETLSYIYVTTHNSSRLRNRVYVRDTVTYREISSLAPCMTTPHATIHQGVHITGECELGPIQCLPPTTFKDHLHTQYAGEKRVY